MDLLQVLDVCVGQIGTSGLPSKIAYTIASFIKIIQIAVPILLIIWGMLDLGKAVMAQKEDEIKKGQQTFIKRLIAAVLVFFITTIVKLVVGLFSEDGKVLTCINEIINCDAVDCK